MPIIQLECAMDIMVIEHLAIEPSALIGHILQSQGCNLHRFTPSDLPTLSDLGQFHGMIIMGGPMSANDTHLPCINDELALIGQAMANGMPMLGICLGAQLMAKAAGGNVMPSPVRELGWYPLFPTMDAGNDPLFRSFPEQGLHVFQWHGETFSLPDKATLLTTDPKVPNQAFRLGSGQYGLQFHVEVDAGIVESWIQAGASERQHLGEAGIAGIDDGMTDYLPGMQRFCRDMTLNWLATIRRDCS
jgi:GMP synthase-like glutamine amidotransferase